MRKALVPFFFFSFSISIFIFFGYPVAHLYATRSETIGYPNSQVSPETENTNLRTQPPPLAAGGDNHDYNRESGDEKVKNKRTNPSKPPVSNHGTKPKTEQIVTGHNSIEVLVNKVRSLPAGYEPPDLVVPDIPFSFEEDLPKKKLRKEAANALEMLFAEAEQAGLQLVGVSAYRSYQRQAEIFKQKAKTRGQADANRVSAQPGESEHQTGLAIDVSTPSINTQLIEEFGETKEGQWLKENAYKYGFIIRYPKGKEEITGYQYEPWHLRYVGKKVALEITNTGSTLEEYYS